MSRFLILLAFLVTSIPSICFASENNSNLKAEFDSLVVQIHDTLKFSKSAQSHELDSLNEKLDNLFKQSVASNSEEQENFVDAYSYLANAQQGISSEDNDSSFVFVEISAE